MTVNKRTEIKEEHLPGRVIQKAVGKDAAVDSTRMTVGFASYSAEAGVMEPHQHAEETVYILRSEGGRIRWGDDPKRLEESLILQSGMILHFPELEWHVFEYDEGGIVEILFIYGQVDKIRPEEIE
jgi:hypothetical protein